ncbi:orotate phosphoribosyltransferase, partial [Francisella tularensis subsp. holarctica]|nr:orotate phosphoribosyltransferase [Francisella tularensis subsp. holarctica]
ISATKKISQEFNIPVLAVTNCESNFEYVKENLDETMIYKFKQYRQKYGS